MIFYIDLLYMICVVMNYLILKTHSVLLSFKLTKGKIFVGALMGSIISVKSICISKNLLIDFFLTLFILRFLYGKCKIAEIIRRFFIFFGTELVFGAVFNMFAIFYKGVATGQDSFYVILPWWWYLLGMSTAAIVVTILVFFIKHKRILYDIEIVLSEEVIKTRALLDTGNRLYEPRSQKPVIIVEESLLSKEHEKEDIYIKTAGNRSEHMEIVFVQKLILLDENRVYENLYAALALHPLSKNGEFHSLLHSKLIN